MNCPYCGNMKHIKLNLFTTFRKTKKGSENELQATCMKCKQDFGSRYTLKVVNGNVVIA